MNTPDPAELALLREIRDELLALPAAIAAAIERQRHVKRPLSRADAIAFAKLLPAISAALPNETFSVRLLRDYAELDAQRYVALRDALVSAGGSRRLGHLLRRGSKSDVPGFLINAVGENSEGLLWSITKVVNLTTETHKNPRRRVTVGAPAD